MIDLGADVNFCTEHDETALTDAVWRGQVDCVKELLANGALTDTLYERWDGQIEAWQMIKERSEEASSPGVQAVWKEVKAHRERLGLPVKKP